MDKSIPKTYQLNAKLSYGRSPIKIQSLYSRFNGLEPISLDSPLVSQNQFRVDSGKKWYDLLQFADCFHFAISRKVKDLLEQEGITGWNSFPIEIVDEPTKDYHAFFVDAMVGKLTNLEALNAYETEVHEFDLSSWEGTDFFSHEDSLNIICTEKVKILLERKKVSNMELQEYLLRSK